MTSLCVRNGTANAACFPFNKSLALGILKECRSKPVSISRHVTRLCIIRTETSNCNIAQRESVETCNILTFCEPLPSQLSDVNRKYDPVIRNLAIPVFVSLVSIAALIWDGFVWTRRYGYYRQHGRRAFGCCPGSVSCIDRARCYTQTQLPSSSRRPPVRPSACLPPLYAFQSVRM